MIKMFPFGKKQKPPIDGLATLFKLVMGINIVLKLDPRKIAYAMYDDKEIGKWAVSFAESLLQVAHVQELKRGKRLSEEEEKTLSTAATKIRNLVEEFDVEEMLENEAIEEKLL